MKFFISVLICFLTLQQGWAFEFKFNHGPCKNVYEKFNDDQSKYK